MSMQSDAVTEIRERAHRLADQIGRAHDRYETTGRALIAYAERLTEAQASSLKALTKGRDAHANLILTGWAINNAERDLPWSPEAASRLEAARRQEAASPMLKRSSTARSSTATTPPRPPAGSSTPRSTTTG